MAEREMCVHSRDRVRPVLPVCAMKNQISDEAMGCQKLTVIFMSLPLLKLTGDRVGTLLRDVSSRHQPGKKKSEVGWLLSSLRAETSGEQALLMMAVLQLKTL